MITLVYTGEVLDAIPDANVEHFVGFLIESQNDDYTTSFSTQNVLFPIRLAIIRGELKPENIVVALDIHSDSLERVECHFDAYGDMEPYPEIFSQQAVYARNMMLEASKKRIAARS